MSVRFVSVIRRGLRDILEAPFRVQAILAVLALVGTLRWLFEVSVVEGAERWLAQPGAVQRDLAMSYAFYTTTLMVYAHVLGWITRRGFEAGAKLMMIGILFGLTPPIIDTFLGGGVMRPYNFFSDFSPLHYAGDYQPLGETITVWGAIVSTGVFAGLYRRSLAWLLIGTAAGYATAFIGHWIYFLRLAGVDPFGQQEVFWITLFVSLWAAGVVAYLVHAWPRLVPSVVRLNHALPVACVAFAGAVWAERTLTEAWLAAILFLWLSFVVVLHNDWSDAERDRSAGRDVRVERSDVLWFLWFTGVIGLGLLDILPELVLPGVVFLLIGYLYQSRDLRLKDVFCLSYMLEGAAIFVAFFAGTGVMRGLPEGTPFVVPALLALGGGALLSMFKDWKDLEADRRHGVRTIYLWFGDGSLEAAARIHRFVGAAVLVGLLIPALGVPAMGRPLHWGALLSLVALGLWLVLVRTADPRAAVERAYWLLVGYLVILIWAIAS